jgi:hypothetical protein
MGYYTYKSVRDLLPDEYRSDQMIISHCCGEKCLHKTKCTYDGDPGYDGDMWLVTSYYIEDLQKEIEQLKAGKENQ